ncbi:putative S-layer protein [Candidatus Woesearchaeota archaeon]|jgi:hypothetical protein|nr:putative S-layer protein [Candidatus Woesearchaeota archaeon]
MVNIKKMISVALMVLIGLTSLSVAFAATSTNGDFTAVEDTNALSIAHGQSVSGTITITNNVGSGAAMIYDLSATGIPAWMTLVFYDGTGALITQTSSVADSASIDVTYTATVTANTAATSTPQAFSIVVGENGQTNDATISMTVDVPSDTSRVITQDSVISTVARESSVEITVAIDNTGNENVVISQTLEALSAGSNTYLALGELTLNWNNGRSLSTATATVAPETGTTYAISAGNSQNFVITILTVAADRYGVYTGTLSLMDNSITPVSKDTSALTINIVDANNEAGLKINDGANDGEFNDLSANDARTYPGDSVEIIDITIDNEVGKDLENVFTTISVYSQVDGDKIINEFESDYSDINDNRDDQFDYAFQLPFDIIEGTYVLEYVVEAEDVDGNIYSKMAYDTFTVEQDSDHLAVESITVGEYCAGETAEVKVNIANIGTTRMDDTDDIQVRMTVGNFNFDETIKWTEDFRSGDSELFTFNVEIPETATGSNLMDVSVFHDRDTDSGDDGSTLSTTYQVATDNCAEVVSSDAQGIITGTAVAEGTVGNPARYDLTILNTGSSSATYDLEISGITGWATSQVEPASTITVGAGETATVYVYLTPTDDAAESNAAVITLKSGETILQTKTVTMNVAVSSISTYTNALLGSSFADFGTNQQNLITLLSLVTILFVTVGTLYTATQPTRTSAKNKKKRATKKERK